jgi:hypothetical protein
MASCATCGRRLPRSSRYCPHCGRPAEEEAAVQPERSDYGVTPTSLVVVLALLALAGAVVLFALGHWPFGLILLGIAVLLGLVVVETGVLRDRAGLARDSVTIRGRAARQLLVTRRELRRLGALRARALFELGDAVYRGDEQATEAARSRVSELDEHARQKEAEMQTAIAQAHDRINRRRQEVAPTEMVEVPDPQPPPQQDPSGPAVIPEPYPPPDEGNPPEPAVIPEPGPLAPEEPKS